MSRTKDIKQSDTTQIRRSQIALNPYNPKRHTDKQVKQQVANIKANGYLGGIVWNRLSGNLIDGHRRVQALDIINKYDGTTATDYPIKVEAVEFDDKTELEQLTYMAVGNSKADYNLIAQYAEHIDIGSVGLTDEEAAQLASLIEQDEPAAITDIGADLLAPFPRHELESREQTFDEIASQREETSHADPDSIKAKKQKNADVAANRNASNKCYIMVDFACVDDLQIFCEATGMLMEENMIINGMELLDKLGL